MAQAASAFTMTTLERTPVEKFRRKDSLHRPAFGVRVLASALAVLVSTRQDLLGGEQSAGPPFPRPPSGDRTEVRGPGLPVSITGA